MHPAVLFFFVWLVLCAAATAILLIATNGEPVCDGPLIYDWDDASSAQCNAPIEGLARMMPFIAFGAAVVTWIVAAATELARRDRQA